MEFIISFTTAIAGEQTLGMGIDHRQPRILCAQAQTHTQSRLIETFAELELRLLPLVFGVGWLWTEETWKQQTRRTLGLLGGKGQTENDGIDLYHPGTRLRITNSD